MNDNSLPYMPKLNLNLPKNRIMEVNASILSRTIAFIIDFSVLLAVFWIIPFSLVMIDDIPEGSFMETKEFIMSNPQILSTLNAMGFVFIVMSFLYFFILERKLGQTLGKAIMKIYIRSTQEEITDIGKMSEKESRKSKKNQIDEIMRIKTWQSFVRNLYILLLFVLGPVILIEPISMLISRQKQRFSEQLSKTKTVQFIEM